MLGTPVSKGEQTPNAAAACHTSSMRVGIAHHLGWAVMVTSDADFDVVDRRRVQLVDDGLSAAPVHHIGGPHVIHHSGSLVSDEQLAEIVTTVRASVTAWAHQTLTELHDSLGRSITSVSVRGWPEEFPTDLATLRRAPYESRADSVMYCQEIARAARTWGWHVHSYDAGSVEAHARRLLGPRAPAVLDEPRVRLGPPWTKDHRLALSATVVAASIA